MVTKDYYKSFSREMHKVGPHHPPNQTAPNHHVEGEGIELRVGKKSMQIFFCKVFFPHPPPHLSF